MLGLPERTLKLLRDRFANGLTNELDVTNQDSERSAAASTELAATVSEVAGTALELARVAENLAQAVSRYKI